MGVYKHSPEVCHGDGLLTTGPLPVKVLVVGKEHEPLTHIKVSLLYNYNLYYYYLRQEGYIFGLLVCHSVCPSDYFKSKERIYMKPEVCFGPKNNYE